VRADDRDRADARTTRAASSVRRRAARSPVVSSVVYGLPPANVRPCCFAAASTAARPAATPLGSCATVIQPSPTCRPAASAFGALAAM
jgi:hypothetical protein